MLCKPHVELRPCKTYTRVQKQSILAQKVGMART